MSDNNKGLSLREINVTELILKLWSGKKYFFITLPITLILCFLFIFTLPRTYTCVVKLAPESSTPNVGGLGSLASSFGFNMSNLTNQDAIVPELYPDLMKSKNFQVSLFSIPITTKDTLKATYFDYLQSHQKTNWWGRTVAGVLEFVAPSSEEEVKERKNANKAVDPFRLTKTQELIAKAVEDKVKCSVDKKTDVITITVVDQDPLVAAIIADSARVKLQQFIIEYRTKKARNDLDYATKLSIEAKKQYLKAQQKYAAYADANEDVILESFKAKRDELENDMQLQYNNYQQTTQQMMIAKAKLQERIPAFTTLQTASVPIKPTGPKRMFTTIFWLFVVFVATSVYVMNKKTKNKEKK